jgi:hypothetical protein
MNRTFPSTACRQSPTSTGWLADRATARITRRNAACIGGDPARSASSRLKSRLARDPRLTPRHGASDVDPSISRRKCCPDRRRADRPAELAPAATRSSGSDRGGASAAAATPSSSHGGPGRRCRRRRPRRLLRSRRGSKGPPPSAAPSTRPALTKFLRLHLSGFGTPLPTAIGSGPQGQTLIGIYSHAGARLGTARVCVLTVMKVDRLQWGVRRIVQTVREVDWLPFSTVVSLQRQTVLFARDQRHTTAIFRRRVIKASGRFAHRRGTVSGGGRGLDDTADWVVTLRLR